MPPTSARFIPEIASKCARPESRKAWFTSSVIAPRLPVISAAAMPPLEPGNTAVMRFVMSLRSRSSHSRQPPTLASSGTATRRAGLKL